MLIADTDEFISMIGTSVAGIRFTPETLASEAVEREGSSTLNRGQVHH